MNKESKVVKNIIIVDVKELPISCPSKHTENWNLHPKVFLEFNSNTTVNCPYCSQSYQLKK